MFGIIKKNATFQLYSLTKLYKLKKAEKRCERQRVVFCYLLIRSSHGRVITLLHFKISANASRTSCSVELAEEVRSVDGVSLNICQSTRSTFIFSKQLQT